MLWLWFSCWINFQETSSDPEDEKKVFNHYDRLALASARGIALPATAGSILANLDEDDKIRMDVTRRNWFYLPLMHSEDLSDHQLLMSKLAKMRIAMSKAGDEEAVKYVENSIAAEDRHLMLLQRFGRYPHRNASLGRTETAEEKLYLQEGGERFGRN